MVLVIDCIFAKIHLDVDAEGEEKLYFVVETKGSQWWDDLRRKEGAKIRCGEKHFAVLADTGNPAKYVKVTNLAEMLGHS